MSKKIIELEKVISEFRLNDKETSAENSKLKKQLEARREEVDKLKSKMSYLEDPKQSPSKNNTPKLPPSKLKSVVTVD